MEPLAIAAFGTAGVISGAILTYLGQRLLRSGNVAQTSADKLWESYGTLLNAYVNDNGNLRKQVTDLQAASHDLALRAAASEQREEECDRRNIALTADVARLQEQMERFRQSLVETATVAIDGDTKV